jgi:hypothetical protein
MKAPGLSVTLAILGFLSVEPVKALDCPEGCFLDGATCVAFPLPAPVPLVEDITEDCPAEAGKEKAGWCGCFRNEDDCDGDGVPNCADPCECDASNACAIPDCVATEPVPTEPVPTEPVPTEPVPTEPVPTEPVPTETPGAEGDPHFKTWTGEKFDFHGACDLVLLHNPDFHDGRSLDIHIRTTRIERMFSFISGASVQVGNDSLEVSGSAQYWINGVAGEPLTEDTILAGTVDGYPIKFRVTDEKKDFIIYLDDIATIAFSTFDGYVGVEIYDAKEQDFGNSVGLLGTFKGVKVGRDMKVIDNFNDYGQSWQVLDTEPKLFHEAVGPQYPEKCHIPSVEEISRRLSETKISADVADRACAGVSSSNRSNCIFDVMATGNTKMAHAYR